MCHAEIKDAAPWVRTQLRAFAAHAKSRDWAHRAGPLSAPRTPGWVAIKAISTESSGHIHAFQLPLLNSKQRVLDAE